MESVWMDAELPRFPALRGNHRTDVLIIGGGMAGILCAHMLRGKGVDCVVAEASRIGGGITKNTTAKITAQHGLIYQKLLKKLGTERACMYLAANLDAVDRFRELCGDLDCVFTPEDNYVYSRSGRDRLDRELKSLQILGYSAEFAEHLPLPFPTAGAVKFPRQAQFHPLKFLGAISGGLTIFENTAVRALGKHTAITDYGTITADSIIVATHFPFLNKHGGYFLKLYQQRSYVLALEQEIPLRGMYLDTAKNGLSFRGYGSGLLLGGGGHRTGKSGGGWEELEDFAGVHYPGARITHRWATQDCMSLDGIPYIGRYGAATPNLYVAAGFNKWGMTSSMVAARSLSNLITGAEDPYAAVFSPSRSILQPQLAVNAAHAVGNLLSFSTKRCPHMGCALKWNPREHSWDCPCHGSRFESDGTLIDNPAAENLKQEP